MKLNMLFDPSYSFCLVPVRTSSKAREEKVITHASCYSEHHRCLFVIPPLPFFVLQLECSVRDCTCSVIFESRVEEGTIPNHTRRRRKTSVRVAYWRWDGDDGKVWGPSPEHVISPFLYSSFWGIPSTLFWCVFGPNF